MQKINRKWTEWIAIGAVINYSLYLFLRSTTFWFTFTELYQQVSWYLLVIIGAVRLGMGLYGEWKNSGTSREKTLIAGKIFIAAASILFCEIVAQRFRYTFLSYLPFAAFCLYGIKPEKILKIFIVCIGSALAVTILCALSGSIINYLYPGYGRRGQIRAAYGIVYPTDFASYFIYLFLFCWCARRREGKIYTAAYIVLALFMGYMLYTYPHSETSTICSILIAVVVLYVSVTENNRKKSAGRLLKVTDSLAIWAFPILGAVIWIMTVLYGTGNETMARINELMSGRLNLIWTAFRKYGIQAFGALTPQSGWGGGLIKTSEYEFLDSTYALLPIRYGWVLMLLAGAIWVGMTRKALRSGCRRIAYTMALIAFHSFSEHHFPELNFNILLAMPLCAFVESARKTEEEKAKTGTVRWICRAAGIATVFLLLPRALSWVRCVVALNGWTGGGDNSMKAGFFWLGCIAIAALFAYSLRKLPGEMKTPEKPTRNALAGVLIAVCLAAGITLGLNDRINVGAAAYEEQLETERPAVETALKAATEPVYAGQMEEIYKRKFTGFSDRILSPEEIARNGRGSVLLEREDEGYQLMFTGAKFTELTPYSGLFTYNRNLEEEMSRDGYRFDNYYSVEKEANLTDAAARSGLNTEDGEVILRGRDAELKCRLDMDQYRGTYEVTFELELTDIEAEDDENHEICGLRVTTLWGQETLMERTLYEADFGGDGKLTAILEYSTENVRGVDYGINGRDGIEVRVKRVSWKQNQPE